MDLKVMEKHANAFIDNVMSGNAHPAIAEAEIFPMLPENEVEEIGESIRENRRVLSHIIMSGDGRLIDGRNRALALSRLKFNRGQVGTEHGRDWISIEFYDQPRQLINMIVAKARIDFVESDTQHRQQVIAANINRRHLTPDQRASIQVKLKPKMDVEERVAKASVKGGHAKHGTIPANVSNDTLAETDADLAKQANVGFATIKRARRDQALDPAILDATIAGDRAKAKTLREAALAKKPSKPKAASKVKSVEQKSDLLLLELFTQLRKEGRTREQLYELVDKAFS